MFFVPLFISTLLSFSFAHPAPHTLPSLDSHPRGHTYPTTYDFGARDGWEDITVRNTTRSSSPLQRSASSSGLTGDGSAEEVKITYYTGVDLLNPSCWSAIGWAPSNDAYVCALTISGWSSKPECFDFIELCAGSNCVFVRVVDSCAGCVGQHVDLTEAPFKQLAGALSVGTMMVKMRKATSNKPDNWDMTLWGPQI